MNRIGWLLVSMSLHGVLIYWLASAGPEPISEEEKIKIEIVESRPEPSGKSRAAARGRGKGSKRGTSLRALVPSGAGLFRPKGQEYYDKIYAEAKGSSEWPEDHWGSHGVDLAQFAEHLGHMDQMREEIENLLFYPGRLARHNIQGAINVRLTFAKDSTCAFKKTRVDGAQPYLRVYILALIDKFCRLTMVPRMGFREGQFVDLSFNFYISENAVNRQMDEQMSRIAGNVITFQRGFTNSSLEWELGPIRGTWFAPMVFLDFPWILENWEKYVDKKDPFRDFK